MKQHITGILFDLGDTLLDFGHVDIRSLFESGAQLAYDYLEKLGQPMPSFASYHRKQLWAIRWNYLVSHLTKREFNAMDLMGRLSAKMGHKLTADQMVELAWLWYQPLGECATIEPGTREMLEQFQSEGLKLGIVSNTFVPGEALDRHLREENLLELLPIRVYSCDVRYRKPDPNIFAIALERAGLQADQTLFVGDSLEADIQGANQAGLVSVLKDPSGRHASARTRPKHRIRRLKELTEILAHYNGT